MTGDVTGATVKSFNGNVQRATVFMDRYAAKDQNGEPMEHHPEEMWMRVARAMSDSPAEEMSFFDLMDGFKFVPGGRINAGAGTKSEVTFYNCYVIPIETKSRRQYRAAGQAIRFTRPSHPDELAALAEQWKRAAVRPMFLSEDVEVIKLPPPPDMGSDSREAIIDTLGVMVDILSHGGGVGINWSTLRPKGAYLKRLNGTAGGPVGWMDVASKMVEEVEQGGSRRGAAMFMLDDWHPDLLEFINVKRDLTKVTGANLSIAVSDAFMTAVKNDESWTFIFPDTTHPAYNDEWDGDLQGWLAKYGLPGVKTYGSQPARDIWRQIAEMAWDNGEPGLVFLDRYNKLSTGGMVERLISVNPCGEQGLGAYSVCNLGSMNLAAYVKSGACGTGHCGMTDEECGAPRFDWGDFKRDVAQAVRFLDNAIDKNFYFLPENEDIQKKLRRIGLGVMGLADALIRLGIRYGSPEAVEFTENVYRSMKDAAIKASMALAEEKGPAPAWDDEMWKRPYLAEYLERHGNETPAAASLRNIFLLTQAPTGTTSLLAGVSSGIEPWFDFEYTRTDRTGTHVVRVPVYEEWHQKHIPADPPDYFVTANDVSIEEHIAMQAAAQKWIDSSISKTVNAPNSHTVEDVEKLYWLAYESGLKGIAYFRDGCGRAQVLSRNKVEGSASDERIALARDALIATGYFKPDEVGDDIAPRIIEMWSALQTEVQELAPHAVAMPRRPVVLRGNTRKVVTKVGSAYVTINRTDDGKPVEVFVNVGKAGTDVMEMGEAMGRILSLAVRHGASLSELGVQLRGVGGYSKFQPAVPSAIGDALLAEDMAIDMASGIDQSVVSVYDADKEVWRSVGTLKEASFSMDLDFQPGGFEQFTQARNSGQLCGECQNYTVVREEGCIKCQSCGWSAC